MEITWRVFSGEGEGKNGGKGTGQKQQNWQTSNKWREVKNGIGNREVKEFICMTHRHELRVGGILERWGCRAEGGQKGKFGKTVIA